MVEGAGDRCGGREQVNICCVNTAVLLWISYLLIPYFFFGVRAGDRCGGCEPREYLLPQHCLVAFHTRKESWPGLYIYI